MDVERFIRQDWVVKGFGMSGFLGRIFFFERDGFVSSVRIQPWKNIHHFPQDDDSLQKL